MWKYTTNTNHTSNKRYDNTNMEADTKRYYISTGDWYSTFFLYKCRRLAWSG